MADTYLNPTGLTVLKNWIKNTFAGKTEFDALDTKVDGIVATGGEANTIETISVNGTNVAPDAQKNVAITTPTKTSDLTNDSNFVNEQWVNENAGAIRSIKVNGTAQTITDKEVNISVPTKVSDLQNDGDGTTGSEFVTKAQMDANSGKIDVVKVNGTAQSITDKTIDIAVPTKTSDLTNDSDFMDETAVDNKITAAVASVYKYKGSVATVSDLPASDNVTGDVYDVQSNGANYAWNGTAWDALGQLVDTSALWATADLVAMTTAEVTAILEA